MRDRRRSLTAALGGAAVTLSLTHAPLRAEPTATTSVLLPGAMSPQSQTAFKDAVAGASPQVVGQTNGPVTVRPASGTAPVSMIAMGLDRFNTLTARVKRAIQDEPKPSFLQLLSRRLKTASVPTVKISSTVPPESAGFAAPLTGVAVTQREKLGSAEKLAAALTGARSAGVTAQLSEIASLPDQAKPVGAASAFIARYNDTLDKFGALILDPTAAHKEDLLATIAPTRNALIEVWPQIRAPEMSAVRRDALRRWNALSRQSPLKANYGAVSDFLPATYLQMYEQSRRVVGIGPYASPNCSGIVIGGGWIMTAGHCMNAGRDATFVAVDVDVATVRDDKGKEIVDKDGNPIVTRLPPAQQLRMNVAIDDVWPSEGTGEDDRDPTDYSFIHMVPAGDNHMLSVFLAQLDKDAPFEQCAQPVPKEMAVAVIARHVDNSTKVYDSARVLFPFAMTVSNFDEFSMETGLAIQRFVDENFEEGQRDEEFNTRMTAFEDAYVLQPGSGYEFRMQRTGFGAKRPYMGMDTDTIHGNSGGPVYLRHRPCVVGVFSGGEPDRAVYTVGDWSRHEYATPLSEVKADLKGRAVPAEVPDDVKARRQALYALMLGSSDGMTPQ